MASNIQRGTRGLSAGDWIRLKRLQGAKNFENDKPSDIRNPDPRTEVETGRRIYTEVGGSKIRRPASHFTDYVASQTADYILESVNSANKVGKKLDHKWVCDCSRTKLDVLKGSNGVCINCRR